MDTKNIRMAFFGSPPLAIPVLDALKEAGLAPLLVITEPDKKAPRGGTLISSPGKVWAGEHGIAVIQPRSLRELPAEFKNTEWDVFVVASYGHIFPRELIDMPRHKTLNVHPSLLPQLRGPSPIRSAILLNKKDAVGVTVIVLDEKMDHGPILAQARVELAEWPVSGRVLDELLAEEGGKLLAEVIPLWIKDKITPVEQEHGKATFSKKITKEDGLIDLSDDSFLNYRKICAYAGWPNAYFFAERNGKQIRIKIALAKYENGNLTITRVIPEGKQEMSYEDFLRGG